MGDVSVKKTKEYKYLGITLSEKGTEKVLQEKVTKAYGVKAQHLSS